MSTAIRSTLHLSMLAIVALGVAQACSSKSVSVGDRPGSGGGGGAAGGPSARGGEDGSAGGAGATAGSDSRGGSSGTAGSQGGTDEQGGEGNGGTAGSGGGAGGGGSGKGGSGGRGGNGSGGAVAEGGGAGAGTSGDGGTAGSAAGTGGAGTGGSSGGMSCQDDDDCPGMKCCGNRCVNLNNDILNCGECERVCEGTVPFCDQGTCGEPDCGRLCGALPTCCGTECCALTQLCCRVSDGEGEALGCFEPINGTCPTG